MSRIYLLSPANCTGIRGRRLLEGNSAHRLASRLRSQSGARIGEVFQFISSLYFRGKWAYARQFADPPQDWAGALVITTNMGLISADKPIQLAQLRAMACVDIDPADPRYREPLVASALSLSRSACQQVVLLGSVATGKYSDLLLEILGERLLFPREFVGRGDMSRGGLMLRSADAGKKISYIPLAGARCRGSRPPRLDEDPGLKA